LPWEINPFADESLKYQILTSFILHPWQQTPGFSERVRARMTGLGAIFHPMDSVIPTHPDQVQTIIGQDHDFASGREGKVPKWE
jgi:hypothetical protein